MHLADLLSTLGQSPIVASVQASPGSPLEDPETLVRMANASVQEGVRVLRLQGVENIRAVRNALPRVPTIGLIKQQYNDSDVYITPTMVEVRELIGLGCEVIALDGTRRSRPGQAQFKDLAHAIHESGMLVMADCDSIESASRAKSQGADIVGTTLCGYTTESASYDRGPALDLLRDLVGLGLGPVFAEGRFSQPWEAQAALRIGAAAVVIGGALNDPVKQTRAFLGPSLPTSESVLAVDIGGTWLRCGLFNGDWSLLDSARVALPATAAARLDWIRDQAERHKVQKIAISTGGVVDPRSRTVVEAKSIIPDYVGCDFGAGLADFEVIALNDGLATAWGHACLPEYAGKRVATLALGTGVGCGLVDRGSIWTDSRGDYPRINDLTIGDQTFESMLGGFALSTDPTTEQREQARRAAQLALDIIRKLYHPDAVVVCGGVGLADWLDIDAARTPFGADAGLYGAAALALFPPSP